MTNSEPENNAGGTEGIDDDQLPEDLQASEDNPLAVSLDEREDARSPEELDMQGGKTPEESESDDNGAGPDHDSDDSDDSADSGS